jgi:hypothetical protein
LGREAQECWPELHGVKSAFRAQEAGLNRRPANCAIQKIRAATRTGFSGVCLAFGLMSGGRSFRVFPLREQWAGTGTLNAGEICRE